MTHLSQAGPHVLIVVWAKPKASKSRVLGVADGKLTVALQAPPVDGGANTELIRVLAKVIGVAKARVCLQSGATSRTKIICVKDATLADISQKLALAAPTTPQVEVS